MGSVYLVRDGAGREVALKVIRGRLDERRRARFQREGELTSRLRHPGIVTVLGGGELWGSPYLVYELVPEATELGKSFRTEPLRRRVELVRDAARAVGFAHTQGVVHRDLKPDNMLLDATGRLRVTDFGLAKTETSEHLTRTGAALGTPGYMSPEQMTGSPAGPPSDVWSLGVILYEALCGRLPFQAPSWHELQARVISTTPPPPGRFDPEVPATLESVCAKALAKTADDRYPHANALAEDLDAWLDAGVVTAEQEAAARRRRTHLGVFLLLLCLGGALLALSRPADSSSAPSPPSAGAPPPAEPPAPPPAPSPDPQHAEAIQQRWRGIRGLADLEHRLIAAWTFLQEHPGAPESEAARQLLRRHMHERPLFSSSDMPSTANVRAAIYGDDVVLTYGSGLRRHIMSGDQATSVLEPGFVHDLRHGPDGGVLLDINGKLEWRRSLDASPSWRGPDEVRYVALDPLRGKVASAGERGPVQVRSVVDGAPLRTLSFANTEVHRGLRFTPSGHLLVGRSTRLAALDLGEGLLDSYDVDTGQLLASNHELPPLTSRSLAVSRTGDLVAVGGLGGQALVLDGLTLEARPPLLDPAEKGTSFMRGGAHSGPTTLTVFSGDGRRLVTAPGAGTATEALLLKVWSLESGNQAAPAVGLPLPVYQGSISACGRLVAVGYEGLGQADVWLLEVP
jgi:serine/threonine protein kinase